MAAKDLVLAIETREAIPPDSHPHRLELSCPICFTTICKALAHDEKSYRFECRNGHRYELLSFGVRHVRRAIALVPVE